METNELFFTVTEEFVDERIDKFLAQMIEGYTRSKVQKLVDENLIKVNNKNIKSSYKCCLDDEISVIEKEPVQLNILAENIPLDILYEDDDLLIVNKPQQMVVHPAPGHYTGTLVNALMYHLKDNLSTINGALRPGIVHRIDKDTSGILVVAKNDVAHVSLSNQLRDHTMTRKYVALVMNKVAEPEGRIDKPIGRDLKDGKKKTIGGKNSKHAVTNYKVIEQLNNYTLIEARLETGRTHQIRVHMASIGHPVVGDMVYGNHKFKMKLNGQLLHAKTLGFIHPTKNEYMEFTTELPEHFNKALELINFKI